MNNQSWRADARRSQSVGACVALALIALALVGCGGSDGSGSEQSGGVTAPLRSSDSGAPASAARAAGRLACRGLTPIEAARQFEGDVRRAGGGKRFIELVTEPTPTTEASPAYPRLVGAFYATTLPPSRRAQAAAGCAEELAAHV